MINSLVNSFIVVVLIIIVYKFLVRQDEYFDSFYGDYCKSCSEKTFGQCMKCSNCGFAVVDNSSAGKCMNGTYRGPNNKQTKYFRWLHNDPITRYIDTKCPKVIPDKSNVNINNELEIYEDGNFIYDDGVFRQNIGRY